MRKKRSDTGKTRPLACGERPHTWKYGLDPIKKDQNFAYTKWTAQARYRNEEYSLTLDEYCALWNKKIPYTEVTYWSKKGRKRHDYSMARKDRDKEWCVSNIVILTRPEFKDYGLAYGPKTGSKHKDKNE